MEVPGINVNERKSSFRKLNDFLHKIITVEPVMFLYVFGHIMIVPTISALIYRKVCVIKFNETICDNLKNHTVEEDYVQTQASYWTLVDNLCNMLPGVFMAPIYGVWSDRYGRRFIMALPFIGQGIGAIGYAITSHFMKSHVAYILIGNVIGSILGNDIGLIMSVYSYLSDVVEPKDRTLRNSIVTAMIMLGRSIGGAISGVLLDRQGFIVVFGTDICIVLVATLYIGIWLRHITPKTNQQSSGCTQSTDCTSHVTNKTEMTDTDLTRTNSKSGQESAGKTHSPHEPKNVCFRLFGFDTLSGSIRVFTKKRDENRRYQLVLQLGVLAFTTFLAGVVAVRYLFLRRRPLSWDQTTYGYYMSVSGFIPLFCLLVILPILKKVVHASDTVLSGSGIASFMAAFIVLGLSTQSWMPFLTTLVDGFGGVTFVCLRSLMSCMVNSNEQGQMFALVAAMQGGGLVVSQIIFSAVYPETLSWFPGFVFVLSGLLHLIPMTLVVLLHIDLRRHPVKGMDIRSTDVLETKKGSSDPGHAAQFDVTKL